MPSSLIRRRPKSVMRTASRQSDENQKDAINRRNGQGPNHLKYFLLFFAKDEVQAQSLSPRKPKSKP